MDTSSSSSGSIMMTPYLHFMTGDFLFLKTWQPTSAGAVAGACIGLVVLALFDRWLAATRGALDLHWRQRAVALTSQYTSTEEVDATTQKRRATYSRTVDPFIAGHDIPRGILYSLQMFLMYLLMIAVMTFQAAYFLSIVLGLGIGEMVFGRLVGRIAVH